MPRHRRRWASTMPLPPSPYVPSSSGYSRQMPTRSGGTDGPADVLERRVVGGDVDVAPTGRARGADRVDVVPDERVLDIGVAQPDREVAPAVTGGHDEPAAEALERHVPQPRRVAAVGDAGVYAHH